jgi:hypothetical protein
VELRNWARREAQTYRHGEDRPLGGYLALMGAYAAGTGVAAAIAKRLGRRPPSRVSPWDTAQLAVATLTISRLLAKDPVTSPLRVPFTSFEGTSAPGELAEQVRGDGVRHAVGELLTCPMCLGQWVATALCIGLVTAPATTRVTITLFTAIGGADFLQHLYVRLQQATE